MATTTNSKSGAVRRQGRRVMPTMRRTAQRQQVAPKLTLGELIAAAYDTAAGDGLEVLRLVTSPQMERLLGRRIVLSR